MGTEVLRPHDVLAEMFRFPPMTSFHHRRKNFPANRNLTNLIIDKKPQHHSQNRKTSPRPDKKKPNTVPRRKDDVINNSQVKKVTLLRRGESLDSLTNINSANQHNNNKGTKSPNLEPVDDLIMFPKQIRVSGTPKGDTYAGSAFSMSPSPRSLPVPSFFNNKQMNKDPATTDLRRLLRLE